MVPGPTYIYECPSCGNLMKRDSLRSGNTFSSTYYSDGHTVHQMLPEFPNLTRCKKCRSFLRLSELEPIGKIDMWGDFDESSSEDENTSEDKDKWDDAEYADFLSISDYFEVLETGFSENKEGELNIRILIWKAYNTRTRYRKRLFTGKKDESRWRENCLRLLELLDLTDISHFLTAVELYRNLGEFDRCIQLIESIDAFEDLAPSYVQFVKAFYHRECATKNTLVVKLERYS